MLKEMKLLIFGPPGCGKGTLSSFITQKTHIAHISVGEMIREHIKAHDSIGELAESTVNKGKLIPSEITNELVKERLSQDDAIHSFLLDGYPRDMTQASFLIDITPITGIILMTIDDDLIMKRLLARGRADDSEKTIKDRIILYKETTKPVLDYLKKHDIPVLEIDGNYNINTDIDGIIKNILDWQNNL